MWSKRPRRSLFSSITVPTNSFGTMIEALMYGSSTSSDRKSTRLNSSHEWNSYAVFCLKKKTRLGLGRGDRDLVRRQAVLQLHQLRRALHAFKQLVDRLLVAVHLVQPLGALGRREQQHANLPGRRERQRLLRVQIERVSGGDLEVGVGGAQRQDVIAAGNLLGNPLLRGRVRFVQLGEFQSEPGGERREDLLVADDLLGDERLPQGRLRCGLLPQPGDELRRHHPLEGVDQPFIREVRVGHSRQASGGWGGWGG